MPYQPDKIIRAAHHILDDIHYAAEKMHLITPSEEGKALEEFNRLQKKLLTEFPPGGVIINPASFQENVTQAVEILQKKYGSRITGFGSSAIPFESFESNPETGLSKVRFIIPTLSLLHRYPKLNFPPRIEQGIELEKHDLRVILLDSKTNHQEVVRPENGIIKSTDSDQLKLVVTLASWAIDPDRLKKYL